MYIEELFDSIFNMGFGSVKSPMDERVKDFVLFQFRETPGGLSATGYIGKYLGVQVCSASPPPLLKWGWGYGSSPSFC